MIASSQLSAKKRIFIAGHNGMVGSAIARELQNTPHKILSASHKELDLTNQSSVDQFFQQHEIDQVYLAAAKVGGIYANNNFPADFIYQNLMIQSNVIHAAFVHGVKQLLFLGSSCIYPKLAQQPMSEDVLLTGYLEPTNEPYAIAKIAGIKLCESFNRQYGCDYRSVMPTNLYGPNDNFTGQNSHVIPALMKRIHQAKVDNAPEVEVWGVGNAMREFMHVDDMASACVHIMSLPKVHYQQITGTRQSHINIGTGKDITIRELAQLLVTVVGYKGKLLFDRSKPEGTPRKLLDVSRLHQTGWHHAIELEQGLIDTYQWYQNYLS